MPTCLAWFTMLALIAACGSGRAASERPPEGASTTGAAAELQVVASVYPLAWLAEQVAPGAEVTLLNSGGTDAHDLEITPGQRAAIENADVVLFMGNLDYQPQVEDAVSAAKGEVVDVAEVAGEERLLEASGAPHGHDGDAQADGVADPHLWFDMGVMADTAMRTGDAFAARDPGAANAYVTNADAVVEQLEKVGAELDDLLGGDCEFDEAIVSHVAYAYLTQPRGKELHGITGIDPEAGASGAALAELVAEIRDEGFRHVVAEPVEGRADAEALARETGVDLLDIHPLDTVSAEQAASGFPVLVRKQAATLATAYGCV